MKILDNEEFRPIERYPGYFVSNYGRVMSNKGKKGEHIMSQRRSRYGYMEVMVSDHGYLTTLYVARLVLAAFEGYPADPWLCFAHHLDGDKSNCTLENLKWIICETTDEYDPKKSHRRGVLKPDLTKESMSQAKFNQSEETIDKQRQSRIRTCRMRRRDNE